MILSRITLFVAVFSTVLAAGEARGQMAQPSPPPNVTSDVGIDQKLDSQIPLDLPFRDEEGRVVHLSEYFGKRPVIISLVYYQCPMLCTQVLNGMVETFKALDLSAGREFEVVTVSIDPSETPGLAREKKDQYVAEYGRDGVAQGWHFLTGDQVSISRLAQSVGFRYVYDPGSKQYAHGAGIMVATPKGRIARYLYGIEYGARDLKFALMEAGQNRIGSAVDRILLLCYHYDPTTGKYGVVVTDLLKAGGVLSVILLGGYMFINFRREHLRAVHSVKA